TARVAGAAMEPRTVTAALDSDSGGIKVWTSTQNVFGVRASIAGALGLDEEKVRVLAEDVGGGFGAKGMVFAEDVLTALVAWRRTSAGQLRDGAGHRPPRCRSFDVAGRAATSQLHPAGADPVHDRLPGGPARACVRQW